VSATRASLKGLAKVILQGGRGKIAVLSSYLDGSWADDQKGWFVLAGFIADMDSWVVFEKDWADLLCEPKYAHLLEERNGKAYAHAKRLKRWPADIREQFYLDANYLLQRAEAYAICHTFKQSDLKSAYEGFPYTEKDGVYGAAFKSITAAAHNIAHDRAEQMAFILEKGDPGQGGAFKIFANLEKDGARPRFAHLWKFTTCTAANKEDWGALQAADLHAYSFLKHLESPLGPRRQDRGKQPELHGDINLLLNRLRLYFYKIPKAWFMQSRGMYVQYRQWKKEYGRAKKPSEIPQMPFDDALRQILSAPSQHRGAPKPKRKPQPPKWKRS
jgi:hypothetical protein